MEDAVGRSYAKLQSILVVGILSVAITGAAFATEDEAPNYPYISGNVFVEVQNDSAVSSDDPAAELNDLFNTTEANIVFHLNPVLSIQSLLVVEPVLDSRPGRDRFFGDHGGYFEELYFQVAVDVFRFFGGKFDAPFGTAWDAAPGIWGADFAEDYELAERLGGGVEIALPDIGFGQHSLTATVFLADTSVLSESIFVNRGRTRLASGGPSNTGNPDSFSLTLDSENIPGLPATKFHMSVRHQAPGRGDFGYENGIAVGLQRTFQLGEGRTLTEIVEGVYLDNADAGPGTRYYITGGGVLQDGPWNVSVSYTNRTSNVPGAGDTADHLFQATGGRSFENGMTLNGGYRFAEEDGINTHIFGFLLTAGFSFGPGGISLMTE
jgi:hypothetical protein